MSGPERNAALAAAVLLVLLLLQFALPQDLGLPDGGPARRVGRPSAAALLAPPVAPYPAVLSSDLFAPGRSGAGGGEGEASVEGVAGGPLVLGVVISPRGAVAYLRGAGGLVSARPGSVVGGWRVAAITRDAVVLSRGETRRSVAVGASVASPDPSSPAAVAAPGDVR